MRFTRYTSFAFLLLIIQSISQSINAFTLSNTISSHMVLHAEPQSARLYGFATPNTVITAVLDQSSDQSIDQSINQSVKSSVVYRTFTGSDGRWLIVLHPQPISINRSINLSGSYSSQSINLIDVSFGHVYLCGGQSNMMFTVSESFDANQAINQSINQSMIRLFSVAETLSDKVSDDVIANFADGSKWVRPNATYVGGPLWTYFSAVCWYFGVSLSASLNHTVPIGLIASTVGGTRVEAWTSTEGLKSCGPVDPMIEINQSINQSADTLTDPLIDDGEMWPRGVDAPINLNNASLLYNAMIAPLSPVRLTAVVWYQGEQNSMNATNYACRFPAVIADWRSLFEQPHIFFDFVLLAAYHGGGVSRWPNMRAAQLLALQMPYTGVVAPIDAGDEASPIGGIHSRNKTIVGERLAGVVLNQVYNRHVIDGGPVYKEIVWPINQPINEKLNQSVIILFSPSSRYTQGMTLGSTPNCTEAAGGCCDSLVGSPVVLVDDRGISQSAHVTLWPDSFMITAVVSGLQRIRTVLFNWQSYPGCVLYNSALLPQIPFNATRL